MERPIGFEPTRPCQGGWTIPPTEPPPLRCGGTYPRGMSSRGPSDYVARGVHGRRGWSARSGSNRRHSAWEGAAGRITRSRHRGRLCWIPRRLDLRCRRRKRGPGWIESGASGARHDRHSSSSSGGPLLPRTTHPPSPGSRVPRRCAVGCDVADRRPAEHRRHTARDPIPDSTDRRPSRPPPSTPGDGLRSNRPSPRAVHHPRAGVGRGSDPDNGPVSVDTACCSHRHPESSSLRQGSVWIDPRLTRRDRVSRLRRRPAQRAQPTSNARNLTSHAD